MLLNITASSFKCTFWIPHQALVGLLSTPFDFSVQRWHTVFGLHTKEPGSSTEDGHLHFLVENNKVLKIKHSVWLRLAKKKLVRPNECTKLFKLTLASIRKKHWYRRLLVHKASTYQIIKQINNCVVLRKMILAVSVHLFWLPLYYSFRSKPMKKVVFPKSFGENI